MKIPNVVKEQLRDFMYLLTGYLIICIAVAIGVYVQGKSTFLSQLYIAIVGLLIIYPLGKNIAVFIRNIIKKERR